MGEWRALRAGQQDDHGDTLADPERKQRLRVDGTLRRRPRQSDLVPSSCARARIDRLLYRARDYIHEHIDGDLALEDISEAAHLSKYHFLRLFRRQFGMTPHQYVLNCRVNAARRELDAGQAPGDVVNRYGFCDLSHFNRRFKRIYGMTPRQYRESVLV